MNKDVLIKKIYERRDDIDVICMSIPRNNGVKRDVIIIDDGEAKLRPVFYIDSLPQDEDEAVDYILSKMDARPDFDLDLDNIESWSKETILSMIYPKLVNREWNADRIKIRNFATDDFLDMKIVYCLYFKEGIVESTKYLFDLKSITQDELRRAARKNICGKAVVKPMSDVIGIPASDYPIFIVSNHELHYGASMITSNNLLKDLSRMLGDGFYIIPASVHEVIAIPDFGGDAVKICEAIKSINLNPDIINREDVLSDNLYKYTGDKLEVVA